MKINIKIVRIPPGVPRKYLNQNGTITAHKGLKRLILFPDGETWAFCSGDIRVVKDAKPVLILRPAKRRKITA